MTENKDTMRQLAQKAQERKVIYPQLEFTPDGDKFAEGHAVVRFRDSGFTKVVNPKAKPGMPAEFYSIHVELLRDSDFGQRPGTYQLLTAAGNTSLTDGILKVWQENNEDLKDVEVDIEAYCYQHKQHGKTRGYRVARVG